MLSPINAIIKPPTRDETKPLKILTSFTHESWETGLCKTGHQFYSFFAKGLKRWNYSRPLPNNYHALPDNTIGDGDYDLVFSQTKFGQFQGLKPLADRLHLPIICIEHTDRMPHWTDRDMEELKSMRGNINIFITEYSRARWGWTPDEAEVIRHGIDTNTFTMSSSVERVPRILSVVNDWINRDVICGFTTWKNVTRGLPVFPVGDTKGFSSQSSSMEELVKYYQSSRVFINTSLYSPIPTALLEAMACGCAVVSTNNCAIPEAIKHGVNGFLSNDIKELRGYCELLLNDEELANKMGENARKTILEKFSEPVFIEKWKDVFKRASNMQFRGF